MMDHHDEVFAHDLKHDHHLFFLLMINCKKENKENMTDDNKKPKCT